MIDAMNSEWESHFYPGQGTEARINLPHSLSVISGMIVQTNGSYYVVPISQLVETVDYRKVPPSYDSRR